MIICDKNGQITMINKASRNNPLLNDTESTDSNDKFKEAEHFDIEGNIISAANLPSKRVVRGKNFQNIELILKLII